MRACRTILAVLAVLTIGAGCEMHPPAVKEPAKPQPTATPDQGPAPTFFPNAG